MTNALSAADSLPFVDAGFAVRERLHLLAHDLDRLPPVSGSTRRARRHDHAAVLDLDATAFDGDWHLDHGGLVEAQRATPVTRFRVTPDSAPTISGYAVTGRSGHTGYLQRVAHFWDRRFNIVTDPHIPGNQGPTFTGRPKVLPGQTFTRAPQQGPQMLRELDP